VSNFFKVFATVFSIVMVIAGFVVALKYTADYVLQYGGETGEFFLFAVVVSGVFAVFSSMMFFVEPNNE
jgi:hypothetical protein